MELVNLLRLHQPFTSLLPELVGVLVDLALELHGEGVVGLLLDLEEFLQDGLRELGLGGGF